MPGETVSSQKSGFVLVNGMSNTSMDTAQMRDELVRGDEEIERLEAAIATLREAQARDTAPTGADMGLLPADRFARSLAVERQRAAKIGDVVTLLEVELDRDLEVTEEIRLYVQMREIAANPGDCAGRTERGYGIILPYVDQETGDELARVLAGMATAIDPDLGVTYGSQAFTTRQDGPGLPEIDLQPAANRLPIVQRTLPRKYPGRI